MYEEKKSINNGRDNQWRYIYLDMCYIFSMILLRVRACVKKELSQKWNTALVAQLCLLVRGLNTIEIHWFIR